MTMDGLNISDCLFLFFLMGIKYVDEYLYKHCQECLFVGVHVYYPFRYPTLNYWPLGISSIFAVE